MTAVTFTLPFPPKILWPNGRGHWAEKARAVKSSRQSAWAAALAAGLRRDASITRASLAVTVHPKTRNPIDRDNCVASLKSAIDGIADALGVDDQVFDTPTITFGEPIKGGLLSVTVAPHRNGEA